MNHVKSYKIYEMNAEPDTKELTFSRYIDYMSQADKVKMDQLLDKDPRRWSDEDKKFMTRMSFKNVNLYIGSDGKRYAEDDLIGMGYDPTRVGKESSRPKFNKEDLKTLINSYESIIKDTNNFMTKNDEAYNISKVLQPVVKNLGNIVYELKKNL